MVDSLGRSAYEWQHSSSLRTIHIDRVNEILGLASGSKLNMLTKDQLIKLPLNARISGFLFFHRILFDRTENYSIIIRITIETSIFYKNKLLYTLYHYTGNIQMKTDFFSHYQNIFTVTEKNDFQI